MNLGVGGVVTLEDRALAQEAALSQPSIHIDAQLTS